MRCSMAGSVFLLSLLSLVESGSDLPGCPTFISREEWGARPPIERPVYIPDDLKYYFVHHAASPSCSTFETCSALVRSFQNYHMDTQGWNDIAYTFLIGGDGNVYEGRGWNVEGAHTYNFNDVGYGICFIGDFMEVLPEQSAQDMYFNLTECAVAHGKISVDYEMFGHRQPGGASGATLCPGDTLYTEIQSWPHWTPGKPVL